MKISVLEQSSLSEGSSAAEAIAMNVEIIFEVCHATLGGTMSLDTFAPAHSALTGFRLRQTPFAASETAQVLMRSAN